MTIVLANQLARIALIATATTLVNGAVLPQVQAQEVDLDTFCPEFPLNSRCRGYKSPQEIQNQAPQVVKLKLDSASRNEWIRIEVSKNTVKLLHTTVTETGWSKIVHTVLGVSPIPIPLPNFYGWHDHQTTNVVFQPDSCAENFAPDQTQPSDAISKQSSGSVPMQSEGFPSCAIAGNDSVILPTGMDVRKGRFTINYTEGNLLRSITFRIPADTKLASDQPNITAGKVK